MRSAAKAADLSSLPGVEIVTGDMARPETLAELAAGVPPYLADALAELFGERRKGKAARVSPVAQTILGRRPTSLAEFAARNAAIFRGEQPAPRIERNGTMKHFLIKYRVKSGLEEQRRAEIATFISALDNDPVLSGRITYRCLKGRDGSDYYHLATASDDDAVQVLQSREFFTRYTEQTDLAADGEVEVLPLEMIAQTSR